MSLTSHAPVILTKVIVKSTSVLLGGTICRVWNLISTHRMAKEAEQRLVSLHIKTDVELIGAILSDLADMTQASTSVRVAGNHLHESLQRLNSSLTRLDDASGGSYWFRTSSHLEEILDLIEEAKRDVDHHLDRLVQVVRMMG
jgi:hypothetical protein